MSPAIRGYFVHFYTASGVVWGFLALRATTEGDHRQALLWLVVATFVDATDGVLARLADVARTAPLIDGARLDDIVDYVTYVLVPAAIVWRAELVPPHLTLAVVAIVLLSSACGFARRDAKTADHFFTGFPSYWNIVVLYLLVLGLSRTANAAWLAALALMVFVPVRYIYPSRTETLMRTTVALGAVWSVQVLALIWLMPRPPRALVLSALAFPVYYAIVSFWLSARRRGAARPNASSSR
jgi:phosphatidylcholine synthase